jgi:hypothetical protein
MTVLDKPVVRQTKQLYKGKPIVVELRPHCIAVRQLRSKIVRTVPFEVLFDIGDKLTFLEERNSNPNIKLQKRKPLK